MIARALQALAALGACIAMPRPWLRLMRRSRRSGLPISSPAACVAVPFKDAVSLKVLDASGIPKQEKEYFGNVPGTLWVRYRDDRISVQVLRTEKHAICGIKLFSSTDPDAFAVFRDRIGSYLGPMDCDRRTCRAYLEDGSICGKIVLQRNGFALLASLYSKSTGRCPE